MEELLQILINNVHLIVAGGIGLMLAGLALISRKTDNTLDDKLVKHLEDNKTSIEDAVEALVKRKLEDLKRKEER